MKTFYGIAALLVVGLVVAYAFTNTDTMTTDETNNTEETVQVTPIAHASLALGFGDTLVVVDPTGDAAQYAALGEPDFILLTHAHGDHLSTSTLEALKSTYTVLVAPQSVADVLPESLKSNLRVMKNGEKINEGGLVIEAVPAYNLREEDKDRHPTGRDNGYVVEGSDTHVYIAGDTEDIPEMRALGDIDIAFLPMNPPYTMTVEAAADAVLAFKPRTVYPYHYRTPTGLSDIAKFKQLVNAGDSSINVVFGDWYAD